MGKLKQKLKCFFGFHEIQTMNSSIGGHARKLLDENPLMAIRYSNVLSTKRCKHCKAIDL